MNKTFQNMVGYLWQVLQILAVAMGIITLVLVAFRVWEAFGLIPGVTR